MRLDLNRIALGLEVAVPPLAFLGLMWLSATILALLAQWFTGHSPLALLSGSAVAFIIAVMAAWMRFAGVLTTLAALAAVPGYLVWKLPIYRDFFTHRETRWIKTNRD